MGDCQANTDVNKYVISMSINIGVSEHLMHFEIGNIILKLIN